VNAVRWTLKQGDSGKMVWRCQFACQLNMNSDLPVQDGSYGGQTVEAIKTIQRHYGLVVDGVCGPATWEILETITEG
jgi:g-D-glutamyl-meso-diaminopimelate peptidase